MKTSLFIIVSVTAAVLNFISPDVKCQSSRAGLLGNPGIISGNENPELLDVNRKQTPKNPASYYLGQNFPNPFNPSTTINYSLAEHGLITIKVYNLIGKEMATLVNEEKPAGNYSVKFDGSSLSSGIYFYTMKAGDFTQTKKFILVK
jgi:hypothetical protein